MLIVKPFWHLDIEETCSFYWKKLWVVVDKRCCIPVRKLSFINMIMKTNHLAKVFKGDRPHLFVYLNSTIRNILEWLVWDFKANDDINNVLANDLPSRLKQFFGKHFEQKKN